MHRAHIIALLALDGCSLIVDPDVVSVRPRADDTTPDVAMMMQPDAVVFDAKRSDAQRDAPQHDVSIDKATTERPLDVALDHVNVSDVVVDRTGASDVVMAPDGMVVDTGANITDVLDDTPTDLPSLPDIMPTDTPCAEGTTRCGAACVDTRTDNAHCGRCGARCAAGLRCISSRCDCPADAARVGNACLSLQSDPANCGVAGRSCARGEACVAGMCVCSFGLTRVSSGGCIDLQANAANCGTIGMRCSGAQVCVAGACTGAGTCRSPFSTCSGGCVDTARHPLHCGRCEHACDGNEVCVAGRCRRYTVPAGCTTCPCACAEDTECCTTVLRDVNACVVGNACPSA